MRNKWKKDIALIKKRIAFYRDSDLQEAFSLLKNNINNSREQKSTIISSIALSFLAIEKVLDKTLFDVQLAGALSLCNGNIVEMKTGEGKTLVAVPAAVYFSLFGKGVHVNDPACSVQGLHGRLGVGIETELKKEGEKNEIN